MQAKKFAHGIHWGGRKDTWEGFAPPNFTGLIKLVPEILHKISYNTSNQYQEPKIQNLTSRLTPRAKILHSCGLSFRKGPSKKI